MLFDHCFRFFPEKGWILLLFSFIKQTELSGDIGLPLFTGGSKELFSSDSQFPVGGIVRELSSLR
jgi:hypothetical protein